MQINGSIGGENMMTTNGPGIIKFDGSLYTEGETGILNGKRYCLAHLQLLLDKDKYAYRLDIKD